MDKLRVPDLHAQDRGLCLLYPTYSKLSSNISLPMFYIVGLLILVLQEGLDRRYRQRIWIGFALVGGTFLASVITIYGACRPLDRYWQINPNPGST